MAGPTCARRRGWSTSGTAVERGRPAPGRRPVGLASALAACQAPPALPPPPVAAAATPFDSGPPASPPAVQVEPELCDVLPGVVAAEAEGFAPLRATRITAGRWLGSKTLPGTERCTVEGDAWPRASYSCASRRFGDDNRDGAEARFDALARDLDACLGKPIWFPRDWQRGEPFQFAMGERLQTWTDQTTTPPSQVVLKMQQDLDRQGYQLKLNLESIR